MRVLHDWDQLIIDGGWARKRGISLFSYWLSRKFTFLSRIKYFMENARHIEAEQLAYMETLIKLDEVCGVTPIFGIREVIRERYGKELDVLAIKYNVDVRHHIHIGDNQDPERRRLWEPSLTQSRDTWHFDTKWARGERVALGPGELPIFHVDAPHYLAYYIDYLHEVGVGVQAQT